MLKIIDSVKSSLSEEYNQIYIWLFVSFILGALFYLLIFDQSGCAGSLEGDFFIQKCSKIVYSNFKIKNNLFYGILISIAFILFLLNKASEFIFIYCKLALLFFLIGFLSFHIRVTNISHFVLEEDITTEIIGKVLSIKPKDYGVQIILTDIISDNLKYTNSFKKLRINVRSNVPDELIIGDYIFAKVNLSTPPSAILPFSYDFSKNAFFQEISAVGYAVSDVKQIARYSNNSWYDKILQLRRDIYSKIISNLGKRIGNFASAIMIGETSAIDKEILDNMRFSGISHILAVSGMHLTLVTMLVFIIARYLLNIFPFIANYYDVKQLSSIFSLFGSLFYLIISGVQIAASRAFIMTLIAMLAIMLGRLAAPIRSISIAAFFILLLNPEYITHPSFQLSFIAVISLISGYELYLKYQFSHSNNIMSNFKFYIYSNLYSTLVASLATAPFGIYHFYTNPNYSIIANLLAVPITSLLIMPSAVLTFLLMPFGLEFFSLKIMSFGITQVIRIADIVSSLPNSITYFGHISSFSLLIYSIGFLWLSIWQNKIRLLGLVPIFYSFFVMYTIPKPYLIMSEKAIAIKQDDKILISKKSSYFTKHYWTRWFGQKDILVLDNYFNKLIHIHNYKVFINRNEENPCMFKADLIINISDKNLSCSVPVINKLSLVKGSTILLYNKFDIP